MFLSLLLAALLSFVSVWASTPPGGGSDYSRVSPLGGEPLEFADQAQFAQGYTQNSDGSLEVSWSMDNEGNCLELSQRINGNVEKVFVLPDCKLMTLLDLLSEKDGELLIARVRHDIRERRVGAPRKTFYPKKVEIKSADFSEDDQTLEIHLNCGRLLVSVDANGMWTVLSFN